MYFTVYKITNALNGAFYIGKHQTNELEDGYMGSSEILRRAIRKYGEENFTKEILGVYETKHQMDLAERILVVVDRSVSYNLNRGGHGGWSYAHEKRRLNPDKRADYKRGSSFRGKNLTAEHKEKIAQANRGKLKTTEHRRKLSLATKANPGPGNPNWSKINVGKRWITDGMIQRKIDKGNPLPEGFKFGRT